MKIAVLYIATGAYSCFWEAFYQSSERYFLTDAEKKYFVFTDQDIAGNDKNVVRVEKACEGFPKDSLFRYKLFLELENDLSEFDYIFFFNSNMLFVKPVEEEILPDDTSSGLVAVCHPGYYQVKSCYYPYERNKKSQAYIPRRKDFEYHYLMGGVNGGKAKNYLALIRTCAQQIEEDWKQGIVAIYHDESHLNKYLYDKKIHILSPAYGYPEGKKLPFEAKIIIRDKVKVSLFFKKQSTNFVVRVWNKLILYYKAITW